MNETTPKTMRAAAIDRFGGIGTLTLQTLPVPEFGPDAASVSRRIRRWAAAFFLGRSKNSKDLAEDDWRRTNPRFQGENFDRNLQLVEKLEELAKDKGVTASQIALAWVLTQGDDIVPIPGTKHRKYVEQNAEAVKIALSDAELKQIDEVFPKDVASGLRYPEEMMQSVHA